MKNLVLVVLGIIIGAASMYLYCCNTTETTEVFVAPKGLINPEQAKTLDEAFNSRHKLISDSIVKRPDNRSSWYSLTDMRAYLNYAENEAKGLGYTMDGVRVYLGAHADDGKEVGYTTMFFIPTGTKNLATSSMINLSLQKSGDVTGGSGLNDGDPGNPPSANYPQ